MKMYLKTSVLEEAEKRINRIFDDFKNIVVGFSGGKDSTVVYELTKKVAKERGRLPLKVMFIDQEAEYTQTIDIVKKIMYDKDVEPMWFQVPILIDNASTSDEHYLQCWEEGKDDVWIRQKDEISIKTNEFGEKIWFGLFKAIAKHYFPDGNMCYIAGVRCEESPTRYMGLTQHPTYKDITWGSKQGDDRYTFYPIYDWSYRDVWKYIHDNGCSYNKIYDIQYQYGIHIMNMRVSNLHHETAIRSLFYLQEVDVDLYNRLCKRLPGISTANQLGFNDYFVKTLPFMFENWTEYRNYLLETLITNDKYRETFRTRFMQHDKILEGDTMNLEKASKVHISSILTNDIWLVKCHNFETSFLSKYKKDKRLINERLEREKKLKEIEDTI